MAFVKEKAQWEKGIYQFEITDPLEGGEETIDNLPSRQLANRTVYLKEECGQLEAKITALYEKLDDTYTKYEIDTAFNDYSASIKTAFDAIRLEIEKLQGGGGLKTVV